MSEDQKELTEEQLRERMVSDLHKNSKHKLVEDLIDAMNQNARLYWILTRDKTSQMELIEELLNLVPEGVDTTKYHHMCRCEQCNKGFTKGAKYTYNPSGTVSCEECTVKKNNK